MKLQHRWKRTLWAWMSTAVVCAVSATGNRVKIAHAQAHSPQQNKQQTALQGTMTIEKIDSLCSKAQTVADTVQPTFVRYGAYMQGVLPIHNAAFGQLAYLPSAAPNCCADNYTAPLTLGASIGGLFELPLWERFGLAGRVGASFVAPTFVAESVVPSGANADPLTLRYTLQTQLLALNADALAWYRPLYWLTVYGGVGASAFAGRSFRQSLEVSSDNEEFRKQASAIAPNTGTLEGSSLLPSITAGLSYELPVNAQGTVLAALEVFYTAHLGSMASGLVSRVSGNAEGEGSWFMNTLRAGISLRFAPARSTPMSEVELQQMRLDSARRCDSLKSQLLTGVVSAKILAVRGIVQDGTEKVNPTLRVEEFDASTSRYVLNMIFFSEQSSEIPARYRRVRLSERGKFSLEALTDLPPLTIYHHVLNVVGKRLTLNIKAKMTIVGYADASGEKNNKQLATLRAERVRDYLADVWGIDRKRLAVQTAENQPTSDPLEAEEQRRVELQTDAPETLGELRFDYRLRVITPPLLQVIPSVFAGAGLKQWGLTITQFDGKEDRVLKAISSTKPVPGFIDWNLGKAPLNELPSSSEPIVLKLDVFDTNNKFAESPLFPITTTVETVESKRKSNKYDERVDTYTVFAFNYGTNTIMAEDAAVKRLSSAIRQTLKAGATVEITGFTDSRGAAEVNKRLAQERAQAVAKLLGVDNAIVTGVGVTNHHDNVLPEGRFYNRFVQVDVRTPVR